MYGNILYVNVNSILTEPVNGNITWHADNLKKLKGGNCQNSDQITMGIHHLEAWRIEFQQIFRNIKIHGTVLISILYNKY